MRTVLFIIRLVLVVLYGYSCHWAEQGWKRSRLWFTAQARNVRIRFLDFWHAPTEPTEIFLAGITLWWGLFILFPVSTFNTSPSYQIMQALAPEWVWGVGVSALGLASYLASWFSSRELRRHLYFALTMMWLFFDVLFAQANFWSTATVVYFYLAVSSAWIYLRLRPVARVVVPEEAQECPPTSS